jgi:hypothetical protein
MVVANFGASLQAFCKGGGWRQLKGIHVPTLQIRVVHHPLALFITP